MDSSLTLSPEELVDLTHKVRYSAQAKALHAMGIEHRRRADGTVAVLRAHVELVLGGVDRKDALKRRREEEPNWKR